MKKDFSEQEKKEYAKARREEMKDILAQLKDGVDNVWTSDKFVSYLDFLSKFNMYSASNCFLIAQQCPNATHVAGYVDWQKKFNRHVKKGEKGIKILAPFKGKARRVTEKEDIDADGNKVKKEEEEIIDITKFKVAYVYDISQTEGKEVPKICEQLDGKVKDFEKMLEAIKTISPVPITFEAIDGGANGYYNRIEKRIAIQENMSELQTIKTAIHELTHSLLHGDVDVSKKSRETREVEAESVAYVVSKKLGLETSEYSFAYVATWSKGKNSKELSNALKTIQNTSEKIILGLEKELGIEQETKNYFKNMALKAEKGMER